MGKILFFPYDNDKLSKSMDFHTKELFGVSFEERKKQIKDGLKDKIKKGGRNKKDKKS